MPRLLVGVAAVAVLVASSPAQAQRIDVGARVGYAFPFGDRTGEPGTAMTDWVHGAIPLWLEAGYRLTPSVELGAYFQYAIPRWDSASAARSGSDLRTGLQLNYLLAPEARLAPWIGVGAGWEWLRGDLDAGTGALRLDGVDFMLQGGADFEVASGLRIGPFVALSMGEFRTVDVGGVTADFRKGWHEWLQVGLRGTFGM